MFKICPKMTKIDRKMLKIRQIDPKYQQQKKMRGLQQNSYSGQKPPDFPLARRIVRYANDQNFLGLWRKWPKWDDLKRRGQPQNWRWFLNEDILKMKMTLKWKQLKFENDSKKMMTTHRIKKTLKIKTTSKLVQCQKEDNLKITLK